MQPIELRRKLAWFIGIRAVIITVLLGGAIIAEVRSPGSFPIDPLFLLIAITYFVTVLYAWTLRFVDGHRWLVDAQFTIDALIVSVFSYLTGGIDSPFSSLYVLPIVAGSTVQLRRGGLLVATLSALMYIAVVLGQYTNVLQQPWITPEPVLPPASIAQFRVALNLFGFFAVALLSGSLAEGVRSAGARLAQASTTIADLQAFNQHVIDSLPSGLATTDEEQRILTFNNAAAAITGLAVDSVVGRPVRDVLKFPQALIEALDRGMDRSGARRVEFRYPRAGGREEIDIGLSATHLHTPGGPRGFLITFQDVTEIKKLERYARMQQRLAAVGEMAAGIAHEIRNPLASMSGSIQILRQELPLTPEQEQLMDIVLRESERLNTTIRSFLEYAHPQRLTVARFDIRRALSDTALLLRNSAELGDAHAIDLELPETELWYDADEGQIKQIVWNLATNGLRAMPDGGRLLLKAWREATSDGIVIAVQDQGAGIPPEELDRLFQPFQGTFAKGTGLGLAIVHRIVTDYHGEIHVSSRQGSGTTISVSLPVRAAVTT